MPSLVEIHPLSNGDTRNSRGVKGQRTDGRTDGWTTRKYKPLDAYCWRQRL